jgi:ferritin-like metal-binding protein YciE
MATMEERFMEWLRDAHAMERHAETMMSAMANRIEHFPEVRQRLEQHIDETRQQAQMLESCIQRRGGDTSTFKDLAARFAGMGQGISGIFVGDEVVKGAMASYTFEHMEIAAYTVLIETAELVGDPETSAICQRILAQEQAMAAWLGEHLPAVTCTYLGREQQADGEADR